MSGGTFLRSDDGSLFFVRDEVLDACKVEGDDLGNAEKLLAEDGDAEVEGFAFSIRATPNVQSIRYIQADNLQLRAGGGKVEIPDLGNAASTIMCPW